MNRYQSIPAQVVDMFEIFTIPKNSRRNYKPESIIEPIIFDVSRFAAVNIYDKADREKLQIQVTAIMSRPYDAFNLDISGDKLYELMKVEAERSGNLEHLHRGKIYRDADEKYIDCIVRLDQIPILVPSDLPGKQYSNIDYRGTCLWIESGRVLLTDIPFENAEKLYQ